MLMLDFVLYMNTYCAMHTESSKSGEVERRLAESERLHTSQLSLLQQQLQQETEKRYWT